MSETTSAPETTTTVEPTDTPPPPAPSTPTASKKADDPAERLNQWRAKLDRQADANKRKHEEILRARQALEQERAQHGERLTKAQQLEQAIARLKSGDFEVLKELAGDDYFDKITRAHLDPEAARREADARRREADKDAQIEALKKRLDEWESKQEQERVRAEMAQQQEKFLATARQREADELAIYDDHELLQLAAFFGERLVTELGRNPSMGEVIDAILEQDARPRFTRITSRGYAKNAAATPSAPRKPVEPSTITASDATLPAGDPPAVPRSARERREAALRDLEKKLREKKSSAA